MLNEGQRLRKPDETAFGREPLCEKSKVGTARKNKSRETDGKDTTEGSVGKVCECCKVCRGFQPEFGSFLRAACGCAVLEDGSRETAFAYTLLV